MCYPIIVTKLRADNRPHIFKRGSPELRFDFQDFNINIAQV